MENLDYAESSPKPSRISRDASVAVEMLLNTNIYETIQPIMTDTHDPTVDFGYMECGPSSPVQSASSMYESFEELNTALSVQICSDTLRISLMDQMKNIEGMRLLEDIEQGKITPENIPQFFETSSKLEKNIAFLWSALLNRSDVLEGLLSIGAALNFCDQYGFSALHLAAFSGCLPSTRFLISKQMEVNMQPKCYTPLHGAAFGNSVGTAKLLLDNGALISIDTKTPSYERSLLECAVRANSLDCMKLFIEKGADVNSLKPSGASAIHLAAYLGKAQYLEALLNIPSADPDIRISIPGKESTALHLAADKGYVECVNLLLAKGADSNLKAHWGLTALHLAIRKSSLECVKLLLEKGNADPNVEDFYHRTSLHAGVGKSEHAFNILETLISFGANINHQDIYGFTALHLAAYHGLARCAEALLNAPGADPDIGIRISLKGSTALHLSAHKGNVECVDLLLAKGADSDLKNDQGFTALHLAARASNLECVKLLLEKGNADPNAEDIKDWTPLHVAVVKSEHAFDILQTLISWGANVNQQNTYGFTAIHFAAIDGLARCLEALLNAPGADPNIGTYTLEKNLTPLHSAAYKGNAECVNILLAKGADSNLKDDWGFTALHLAARKSYLKCVKLLLEKGNANVNHQDMYGFTALHLAARDGLAQCVEMLISFGADVTIKTKKGITALNYIIRQTPAAVAMITHKFDAAITLDRSQDIESKDVELKLNFRQFLQDSHPHEISYLNTVVDEGQTEILEHPLCSAFLYIKWEKIRKYYYSRCLFCFAFVLFLTLYVLAAVTQNCYNDSNEDNTTI